jgi:hypothetical protein
VEIADILSTARKEGRALLSYEEGKRVLEMEGVPVSPWRAAADRAGAGEAARIVGSPVVMKILSPDIVHKSDAGGVATDLRTREEVEQAFDGMMAKVKKMDPAPRIEGVVIEKMAEGIEVIVGATRDPQFGPVLMFGMGGILVELLRDTSFRLIPIEPSDAEDMIKELRGHALLQGFREPGGDIASLQELLMKISGLMSRFPEIKGIDLNPVMTSPAGSVATDVRIMI